MSGNLWDQPGVPHSGWTPTGVVQDLREGIALGDEDACFSCQMCRNEKIRWVHWMKHPEHETLGVGSQCASKMCGDRVGTMHRDKEARNRTNRLLTWLGHRWKQSNQGFYRVKQGYKVGAKRVGADKWTIWIIRNGFAPIPPAIHCGEREAKIALFEAFEKLPR